MPTKTWKSLERYAAKVLGTVRNPLSGRNNVSDNGIRRIGDVVTKEGENWFAECKHRQRFAFHSLFKSIAAEAPTKTLFLFTHEHGTEYRDSLVTLKSSEFEKIWPLIRHLYEQ